jgi:hypothetical protein
MDSTLFLKEEGTNDPENGWIVYSSLSSHPKTAYEIIKYFSYNISLT